MNSGAPDTSNWQIPAYVIEEFFPKKSKYCVCIFVVNEGEKIRAQLRKMSSLSQLIDIIIADGGSTDRSLEPVFLQQQNVRTLLIKSGSGRLSAQMRMAFDYALQQQYHGIVTIDGNDKDDPEAIPSFIEALDLGYDHIQGSRFTPGGKAINTPLSRLLGVRLLHAPLISLSSGFHYTDTTNGFRAYSRRFLLAPDVNPFRDVFSGYELHYYLAIRSARLGFKLTELPVTRRYPEQGKTPTKISPLRGNMSVLCTLIKACMGYYSPKPEHHNVTEK